MGSQRAIPVLTRPDISIPRQKLAVVPKRDEQLTRSEPVSDHSEAASLPGVGGGKLVGEHIGSGRWYTPLRYIPRPGNSFRLPFLFSHRAQFLYDV